jgi:hypothetical protein
MHLIIATFVQLFLLRWLAMWLLRSKRNGAIGSGSGSLLGLQSLQKEIVAWLIAIGFLVVLFLIALVVSYLFGGFAPIHEWGS